MVSLLNLHSWKKKLKITALVDTKWQKYQYLFSLYFQLNNLKSTGSDTTTVHFYSPSFTTFPSPSLNDFTERRDFLVPPTYHLMKVKSQLGQED